MSHKTLVDKISKSWEYCECGCHGFTNRILTSYWCYIPTGDNGGIGVYFAHRGRTLLAQFPTFDHLEISKVCLDDYRKRDTLTSLLLGKG